MANRLYIAGAAPRSGKAAVTLGLMELFAAYGDRVGFFRPIVATPSDSVVALMTERYRLPGPPERYYGCLAGEAHQLAASGHDELTKRILEKFQALEAHHDLIVCEGSDFGDGPPGLEFEYNLELANHLGCLVVPVLNGKDRQAGEIADDIQAISTSLAERHCQVFAIAVNRTPSAARSELDALLAGRAATEPPVALLAEQPVLDMPTVGEVATALGATHIGGDPDGLGREVRHFKVAAMELPHFLDHVEDGSLIITPGDRSDIIVGALLADASAQYPRIAGLLLTGGLPPAPQILKLIGGLGSRVPLLSVANDTYNTATAVHGVEPRLAPGNPRKVAAALGLLEGQVNRAALNGRFTLADAQRITPLRFEYELIQRAKKARKHIVLPEGGDERILKAAEILLLREVADITLLGEPEQVRRTVAQLGLRLDKARIVDPYRSELRQRYAEALHAERRHKGITVQMAWDMVEDVSYFGTLMVHCGDADGMVSGALHTTQHTIRPAFQVIRARPGASLISSVFLMSLPDRVLVYGDCAVNPDPSAEQLAEIAITSAATAARFGIEPRVAMLSYSTGDSGSGSAVDKVREAVRIARTRAPGLKLEGPIQYDAAVDMAVARTKLSGGEVAGRATVFVFPDLNTGNNTYKAVQRSAGAVAIGPILQGLNKPVNDLSRGCTVTDIVNTVAITAIQAQQA